MTTRKTWPLVQECLPAFAPHYGPAMQAVSDDADIDGAEWSLLYIAYGSKQGSLTGARVNELTPYTAPALQAERLAGLVEKRYLATGNNADEYKLTDAGRTVVADSFDAAHAALGEIAVMSAEEMNRLAELLRRVVDASVAAEKPATKTNIRTSRYADPGGDAPAPARIDQYVTDLSAFRDDSHCAAWRVHDIEGYVWEAFTFVWRGDAGTAEALGEALDIRGYDVEAYARALQALEHRGWVVQHGAGYQVTETGQTTRDDAEAATDQYFHTPWICLSDKEHDELRSLLRRLCDRLAEVRESD